MRKLVTMREALTSPAYFGSDVLMGGESWAAWRVLLIAIMGEPLDDAERETFRTLTGRDREPEAPVDEFWGIVGRRGGKTRGISVLAAYLSALVDHRAILAPGQWGMLSIMAASQRQAFEAFNYILGVFETAPALAGLVERQTDEVISLKSRVNIEVRPASFRTARGPTYIGAIADEIAFWRIEGSANPDKEILSALRPGLATSGGPLIAISSPYARKGELFETFAAHYGPKGDAEVLVAKAPSLVTNPRLNPRVVERAYKRDPIAAAAEYGGEFRTDVEAFVTREIVDACTAHGITERPAMLYPAVRWKHMAFVDPSGGSADSMTLAIGHREGALAYLDALREARPPFSPEAVVEEFAELLKRYGVREVRGDRYAGEWPREQFQKRGIRYLLAEKPKSDLYRDLLPMLNDGKVVLLDNAKLKSQLIGLERRTARGGRDSIDHAPGQHDDVVNAAAGLLVSGIRPLSMTDVVDDDLLPNRRQEPRADGVRICRVELP